MKQVINCLKEDNPIINKKLKEVTIDEGLKIAEELFRILNKRKDGIGLAAIKWVLMLALLWLMLENQLF